MTLYTVPITNMVFDYLRDNIEYDRSNLRHRGFYFAIVDEVDSILIDEARSPLIILVLPISLLRTTHSLLVWQPACSKTRTILLMKNIVQCL